MDFKGKIGAAIDAFVEEKLRRISERKIPTETLGMLKVILNATRNQINAVLKPLIADDFDIDQLDKLCAALDEQPVTYDISVLEAAGIPELRDEIFDCRNRVKWDILTSRLGEIIPKDDSRFSPDTIKKLDIKLFNALRDALKHETQSEEFDWEILREKLPDDLLARFEPKKIPPAERIAAAEETARDLIQRLGLADVVASLRSDPKKLAYFLGLAGVAEDDINRIVYVSFAGLRESRTETKMERLLRDCKEDLGPVEVVGEIPEETTEPSIKITAKVPVGASHLLVRGPWKRDIKLNRGQQEVTFDVILQPGQRNEITLLAYNEKKKKRSAVHGISINQADEVIDPDTLVEFLNALRNETLDAIAEDEGRAKLFKRCVEEGALRHFAGNFDRGITYLDELNKSQHHTFVRRVISEVKNRFNTINEMELPFLREDQALMFFQKYCVYLIAEKRKAGDKSVILANEPGLGKTVTGLAATYDDELLAVVPNSAVTTWIEQEAQFFRQAFLTNLAGLPHRERVEILEACGTRGVITNVEFVRFDSAKSDEGQKRKFGALNRRREKHRQRTTVIDEAHFLRNDSQQTEGIGKLEDDFVLLLTASPYRNPASLCRVMAKLFPDDPSFQSVVAFQRAFPPTDPRALKALHLMVQPHVIRFLKSEVMATYDPKKPLNEQPLSLPVKMHIDPFQTKTGLFTLTMAQQQAILEMLEDWDAWTKKYGHYMPKGALAVLDGIRASDDSLTKTHALRQIVNDPKYIGSKEASPKHEAMMKIVEQELGRGGKPLVFCRYHEEVKAYAKMLEKRGIEFCTYTGEVTKAGYKQNGEGKDAIFEIDAFGNFRLDRSGTPIHAKPGARGSKMLAIDYERLTFQNNPSKKVMLATFGAGSQSVTFTAASAIIFDDLPQDYTQQYQAEDRIHRIDGKRRKYEVRYYSLVSNYSDEFLEQMLAHQTKKRVPRGGKGGASGADEVEISAYDRWFAQGTMDYVHYANLAAQQTSFELMNNGVAVDPEMVEQELPFAMT